MPKAIGLHYKGILSVFNFVFLATIAKNSY